MPGWTMAWPLHFSLIPIDLGNADRVDDRIGHRRAVGQPAGDAVAVLLDGAVVEDLILFYLGHEIGDRHKFGKAGRAPFPDAERTAVDHIAIIRDYPFARRIPSPL
jgi:hypothetical protein